MLSLERIVQQGLVYGTATHEGEREDLLLDLYLPETARGVAPEGRADSALPVIVYFHGGGWVRGSRSGPSGVGFALEMAAEGIAVASVDYRLGPAHPAPAAIEDCKLAIRWLRTHAEDLGLDADRIVAMGNSAGGHLAAMMGMTRAEDELDGPGLEGVSSSVAGVIDLCGITDVEELMRGERSREWAAQWIPENINAREELARRCSPMRYIHADVPPMLIVHGDADPYVPYDQAARLAEGLKGVGVRSEFVTIQGAGHFLSIMGSPEVQRQVRVARRRFLVDLGFLAETVSV